MFPVPAVAGELKSMVEARLHTDGEHEKEFKEQELALASTIATPVYLVMDPLTEEVLAIHDGPEFRSAVFADWLAGVIDAAEDEIGFERL